MAKTRDTNNSFDAGRQHLGNIYAKALLGVTEAARNTEAVLEEFDSLIADVLDKLPQFEATLASPRVPPADKERLLDKAFQGKMTVQLLQFLKVVSRHGRLDCLRVMNRAARRILDEMRSRVKIQIRTAEPVGAELLQQIAAKLGRQLGREVVLDATVDPDLIGGLVIGIGDKVYDGSVANQLSRMQESVLDTTTQQIRKTLDRYVVAG